MFSNNEKIKKWIIENADKPRATKTLGILSFLESSIFPIPVDPFMFAVIIFGNKHWVRISMIVTITSVIGALFGYLIGFAFFEFVGHPVIDFYNLHDEFALAQKYFDQAVFWTILTAAFTPVPYKIFTIVGGLLNVALIPFIAASIIGRGARFFLVGYASHVFGKRFGEKVLVHLEKISYATLLIIILIVFYKIVF